MFSFKKLFYLVNAVKPTNYAKCHHLHLQKKIDKIKQGNTISIAFSENGVGTGKVAGSNIQRDPGGRIIAVRLKLNDDKSSWYQVWEEFIARLDTCMSRKAKDGILIIGMDFISSMAQRNVMIIRI